NARLRATARFFPDSTSQTRFAGVFLGHMPTGAFFDQATPGQFGYHVLVRRDGTVDVYRVDPGLAAVSIASQAGAGGAIAPAASWGTVNLEITLTSAQVIVKDLDRGTTATATDATYRGDLTLALSANNTNAAFSQTTLEDSP